MSTTPPNITDTQRLLYLRENPSFLLDLAKDWHSDAWAARRPEFNEAIDAAILATTPAASASTLEAGLQKIADEVESRCDPAPSAASETGSEVTEALIVPTPADLGCLRAAFARYAAVYNTSHGDTADAAVLHEQALSSAAEEVAAHRHAAHDALLAERDALGLAIASLRYRQQRAEEAQDAFSAWAQTVIDVFVSARRDSDKGAVVLTFADVNKLIQIQTASNLARGLRT